MYIWLLGIRYLRSRPISWVSVVGVLTGMMAIFVVDSVMNGFILETQQMIRGRTSDLVISPHARVSSGHLQPAKFETVAQALEGLPGIRGLSPRLNRHVIFRTLDHPDLLSSSRYGHFTALQLIGIDPAREQSATNLRSFLQQHGPEGIPVADPDHPFRIDREQLPRRYRNAYENLIPVVIGERCLENLGLRRYQILKMMSYPDDLDMETLQPISSMFVLVGTFKTDDYEFDLQTALVPIERMRDWVYGTGDPVEQVGTDVHEICVSLEEGYTLEEMNTAVRQRLQAFHIGASVETWVDRHRIFLDAVDNERGILNVILFFIVLVAVFNIFATLSMMVLEKTRDIGILSTMGATAEGIAGLFVSCGLIISGVGAGLGLVAGYLITVNVNAIRVFLEDTFGLYIFKPEVYVFSDIPAVIDMQRILFFVSVIVALSVVASVLPAVRAARVDPVRSLRYE